MICYINRGIILEQAIAELIKDYFEKLQIDSVYKNFHISVTTDHPFAELYMNDGLSASDKFPCVVVSTQDDKKPEEFSEIAINETSGIGIDESDLEEITKTTDCDGKEIAALCTIADTKTLNAIKETIQKQGYCYGYSVRVRRKDTIGIEIWAESVQLKNELYEQVRLFVLGNLRFLLEKRFPFFDIAIFDESINGNRSNNYNFDFDCALSGAHISMEINYCIEQLVLDTEISATNKQIITEVLNNEK